MAVELATAYVSLTTSALGIKQSIENSITPSLAAEGERAGTAASSGFSKKFSSGLSTALGLVGVPLGALGEKAQIAAGGLEHASSSAGGLVGALADIPTPVTAIGAAIIGVGGIAAKFGVDWQSTTASIAANAGISQKAANSIGNAFLDTGATVTFSAQTMGQAYAGVAGQLTNLHGTALTAKQAMDVMTPAMDLSEASSTNLGSSIKDITNVLQAFGLKITDASNVSDILYNTAGKTGVGIDELTSSLDAARGRLGAAAPSLADLSGLLLDLKQHGEPATSVMRTLSSAMDAMLKPSEKLTTDQQSLSAATAALPSNLKSLAAQYQAGTTTTKEISKETAGLTNAQKDLWKAFTSSSDAVTKQNSSVDSMGLHVTNAQGQFVGMGSVMDQLQGKLAGLGAAQATAVLQTMGFGSASGVLAKTIQSGSFALDLDTLSVAKHGTALDGANKKTDTFAGAWDKVKAGIGKAFTALGTQMVPALTSLGQSVAQAIDWISNHWPQISKVLRQVWTDAKPFVTGIADTVKGLVEVFSGVVAFVQDVFHGKWEAAWKDIQKIFDGVVLTIKGAVERLLAPFLAFGPALAKVWADVRSGVETAWNAVTAFFTVTVPATLDKVVSWFTGLPGRLFNALTGIVATAFGELLTAATWIDTNAIEPVVSFFAGIPAALFGALTGIVGTVWSAMTGTVTWIDTNAIAPLVAFFVGLPATLAGALTGIVGTVFGELSGAWGWIQANVYAPIVNGFTSLPGDIGRAIGGAVGDLGGLGTHLINAVIGAINDAINFYDAHRPSFLGFSPFPFISDIGTIGGSSGLAAAGASAASSFSGKASGGPVAAGQSYVVGEVGPELFSPNRSGWITPHNQLVASAANHYSAPSSPTGPAIVMHDTVIQNEADIEGLSRKAAFLRSQRKL